MDYQKIGNLITQLRKEKNMTQKDLATELGITDRAVSKWERGHGCPDVSLLDDLSRILDISILEILKGRRLDKDEIINNRNIIESMNYSKEHIKYRIVKYINSISLIIICAIVTMLIFLNLQNIYYLNKYYKIPSDSTIDLTIFEKFDEKIQKIKNNQGKYNNDDYKTIIAVVNEMERNIKIKNNRYYYYKTEYKYSDIVEFHKANIKYTYPIIDSNLFMSVYAIIYKYDSNVITNAVEYSIATYGLIGRDSEMTKDIAKMYYYGNRLDQNILVKMKFFSWHEYNRDITMLDDIIEAGEIIE